jgi:putative uncharacterized protein (fragment)
MVVLGRYVTLIACLFICLHGHGQTMEAIKASSGYYWAEGIGLTLDEADNNALSQISRQIAVSITTKSQETDNTKLGNDGSVLSDYVQEGFVKSFSFASLRNVEMLVLKDEPDARVFRWVAKAEVDKMFEERKRKIIDFVTIGKAAESQLQIDDALRNYYWALMLAKVNRDAVYVDFNEELVNCLVFLPLKIKSVLSEIKASLVDCTYDGSRYMAKMQFMYNGRNVASLQLRYFDGQSFIGPLSVKDGIGELDLLSLPSTGKLNVRYEYSFRKEAELLDSDLKAIYAQTTVIPMDNALAHVPVKVNVKQKLMVQDKKHKESMSSVATSDVVGIKPEKAETRTRISLENVQDDAGYAAMMHDIEHAIKEQSPQSVRGHFTPDGYKMFATLINETGQVSLVGQQSYEFIEANGQHLGRFCKVKIRFKNGKAFMENLVFRFNKESRKIQSMAFALTQKAEDDIFNAASSWTEISRYTILQFMEDYQTAYALKRLDYLEKIFSDDALIITGTVLNTHTKPDVEGVQINLGNDKVRYNKQTKQQYLMRLRRHFSDREYIHLTFENNVTKLISAPRLPIGSAFAIQIKQIYSSPVYSDQGFLVLLLDVSKELPMIHVRLWQPDKSEMLSLDEFINGLEF